MSRGFATRRVAASLGAAALAILVAHPALARSVSVTGPRGGTRSVTTFNHGGGNFGRTVTRTRPDGQTATSSFNRSVNNGTITDSRSVTGFNGRTASETVTRP
jgi:hypothetical protein